MILRSFARRFGRAGSSFVEIMVSLSLSSIVTVSLASLAFYSSKRFTATTSAAELSHMSRHAMNRLSSELREMTTVTSFATNSITLQNSAGDSITYSWNPATSALTRTSGDVVKTLLTECPTLSFSLHSANPIDGQLDIQPTTKIKEGKAIKVAWTCTRTNTFASMVSSVTAAETIVLRYQGNL